MATQYKVQTLTFCDGWVDACHDDKGGVVLFATEAAAEKDIDDMIADVAEAVRVGDMAECYDRRDWRVVAHKETYD